MTEKRKEKRNKEIKEWVISIIIVCAVAIAAKEFVIGTALVKGGSMEPTLEHDDFLVMRKFGSWEKGDIVICSYDKGAKEENIVKRIIGFPGDVIDIETGKDYEYIVVVNGEALEEPYLGEKMEQKGDIEYPYTVPADSYFVMGDNRNASNDSRSKTIGAINKKEIHGKVFARVFPFERFGLF